VDHFEDAGFPQTLTRKSNMNISHLAIAALILASCAAHARDYGVSGRSAGRGAVYSDNRGGSAYVGPRGVAVQGADGRTAVATDRGAAIYGDNRAVYATGYGAATYAGSAVVTTGTTAAPLPAGYITDIPPNAPTFIISGTTCYFINGIYYHAVFYAGSTVYVPMTF
jgi:hypothetical protein